MKQTTKIVSQREALHKYQYFTHRADGDCEVRVWLNDDGTENPASWNMQYKNEMKKKERSKVYKNVLTKITSSQKGYFGMPRSNPICWIIWIILLPFKIALWFLKYIFIF